jgi:hypothetical protein
MRPCSPARAHPRPPGRRSVEPRAVNPEGPDQRGDLFDSFTGMKSRGSARAMVREKPGMLKDSTLKW